MIKTRFKIASFLLSLVLTLSLFPYVRIYADVVKEGECGKGEDKLTWTLDDGGTLTISGTGDMEDWEFDTPNNWDTTAPWNDVKADVKKIVVGEGVKSIGNSAFYCCRNAETASLPESLESIGEHSFDRCKLDKGITIPESVVSIGEGAFAYAKFVTVAIPSGMTSIANNTFECCGNLSSITIPDGVTTIGEATFYGCSSLTNVTIPEGVTSIGDGAFNCCSSLTSIIIPEKVTSIGDVAFSGCRSLTSITIPDSVTSIGADTFNCCYNLTSITIPEGVTSIGDSAFYSCSSLTSITIPDSVTSIGVETFYDCRNLDSLTISKTLIYSLDSSYFDGCPLRNMNLYNAVRFTTEGDGTAKVKERDYTTGIVELEFKPGENYVFDKATYEDKNGNVVDIEPVDGVYSINTADDSLFDGDINVKAYFRQVTGNCGKNGDKVTWAFDEATGTLTISGTGEMEDWGSANDVPWNKYLGLINSVTISDGVTSIGDSAFATCKSLTSIDIPASVTSIGNRAFVVCESLASITVPEGVTSIGDSAFGRCSSLTNITIPEGVTSIGDSVFSNCSSLISVTIPDSVTSIGDYAFGFCKSLTSIEIPESVTSIGEFAFSASENLTSIEIPNSVYSIEDEAFVDCTGLEKVVFWADFTGNYDVSAFGRTGLKTVVFTKDFSNSEFGKGLVDLYPDVEKHYIYSAISYNNDNHGTIDGKGRSYGTDVVEFTVTPKDGYTLNRIEFTDDSNNTTVLKPDNDGKYTMPDSEYTATVKAYFMRCGTCGKNGDNLIWTLDDQGTLTISGTGEMADWNYFTDTSNTSPWYEYFPDIKKVIVKDGVTAIGSFAFSGLDRVESVTISDSVTSIGEGVFIACINMKSIKLPKNLTVISKSMLEMCLSLKNLDIPEGVTSIGDSAFGSCSSLTSIIIPEKVKSIGDGAFAGCSSLSSINIPDGVTTIGEATFSGCSSLISITIPEKVTSIGDSAFDGCSSLTSINIPDGVTTIGKKTFRDCSNLTSITIPEKVTSIGDSAFKDCLSLTSIKIPEGVTSIKENAFNNCSKLANVTISKGLKKDLDESVFANCDPDIKFNYYKYDITYSGENGTVSGVAEACDTDTVKLSFTPSYSYVLNTVTVTSKDKKVTTLEPDADGKYSFEMPQSAVEVKAVFVPIIYDITVVNGNADKTTAAMGDTVKITANDPSKGKEFDKWTSDSKKVVFADENASSTSFDMPSSAVEVTATYKDKTYKITVTNDGNGTGKASASTGIMGDEITLTASPAAGYKFKEWKVVSGGVTVADNKFEIGTANVTVKAIFEAIDYTVTVTTDGNGTATATKATGNIGDEVTLSATANAGYTFKEWKVISGGVTVADNKFTVGTADVTVKAIFEAVDYTVTVTTDGNGTASATMTTGYIGDEITLTATANAGYKFKEWEVVSGGVTVADNKFTIGTANVTVKAVFEAIDYTVIVLTDGHGTVSATKTTGNIGDVVTLSATPAAGYKFKEWKVISGGVTVADNKLKIGSADVKVQAIFEPVYYAVKVTSEGNGTVTSSVSSAIIGTEVTLTATPDAEDRFAGWEVVSGGITLTDETKATTTFTMVTSAVEVKAVFVPKTYTVMVIGGTADNATASKGDTVRITANDPSKGKEFDKWTSDSEKVIFADEKASSTSFDMPSGTVKVTANFKDIEYKVTVTNDGNGTGKASASTGIMGDEITLTASANAGYKFKEWKVVSGGVTVADNKFTVGTADVTVKAIFEAIDYTVTVTTDGHGTASATKTIGNIGDEVTLSATPAQGYKFKAWEVVSGKVTVADNKFEIGTADVTVKAVFEAIDYTVTVTTDGHGTASATKTTGNIGDEVTLTATPNEGYKFKAWEVVSGVVTVADNKFTVGTADVTVKAVFEAIEYTVKFVKEDGTEYSSSKYPYGTKAEDIVLPDAPSKEASKEFTYTFAGWGDIEDVTGDATYKASYTETTNKYTVTFISDSKVIFTKDYPYGTEASDIEVPDDPAIDPTVQYTYTFKGWSPEITKVTGDATYTAQFSRSVNEYTVTFAKEDGTEYSSSKYPYGTKAEDIVLPDAPGKEASKEFTYTFAGWGEIKDVTGDATYKASYTETTNKYTVTFRNYNDEVISSAEYDYGTEASAIKVPTDFTREGNAQYTYTFKGWDNDIADVTDDATYTATYTETENKYTVKFISDGKIIFTKDYPYGTEAADIDVPEDPAIDPTVQYTYTFEGWTPEITKVTGDAAYTAQFSSKVNEYTVSFADEDGTELQSVKVEYGKNPSYSGETPVKESTDKSTFVFAGWSDGKITYRISDTLPKVTGDAVYKAVYADTEKEYTVTFVNEDGTVLQTVKVPYGTVPAYTGKTPVKAETEKYTYTFSSWTPEITEVTGNATYKAVFAEIAKPEPTRDPIT